jgi:hypothetical protein
MERGMKLSAFLAGCFGTVGFVLAILAGLYADNGFNTVLFHGLIASVACYIVGYFVGAMAQHVADEHAQKLADEVTRLEKEREAKRREEEAGRAAEVEVVQAVPEAGP